MKKILNLVWKFINSKFFGYIIAILAIIILINTCGNNSDLKDVLDRKNRNIEVLNDSIETVITKNGKLESSIGAYEGYIDEIEQYNKELFKKLKEEKGKLVTFNRIIFRLKQDSADLAKQVDELKKLLENKKVNDSTWNMDWTLHFVYDSLNYDIFYGRTQVGIQGEIPKAFLENITLKHNNTWLLNRESEMDFTWGQKYERGKLKVFARTGHPAFQAKLLEGVYVDFNKKDHWFTGFSVGPQLGVSYDFLNNQPAITIGVGAQYNIYTW